MAKKYDVEKWASDNGASPRQARLLAASDPDHYKPSAGHDKHLSDSERAHSGKPGSKVRHGADATGKPGIPMRNMRDFDRL